MSIRMRKQSPRRDLHVINPGSPGPGMYNVNSDKDIGRTKNRMQEWKTPMRKVEWFVRKTESPDVLFSQMMDHKGIARTVMQSEQRLKTTMGTRSSRSAPTCWDGRRASEKIKFKIFEVIPPYFANYDLGPGSYVIQDDKEIGKSKSRLQEWKSPMRQTSWFNRTTEAPSNLFAFSPLNSPSRNRTGGRHTHAWPPVEDDGGFRRKTL